MKKLLPAFLALALLLSACGNPAAEVTPTPTSEPTPTQTAEPTPTPEPTPVYSGVHTDWSKLEPYEPVKGVYTRRYESFTDTLIPADDYGPLIPFAGGKLVVTEEWYIPGYYETFNLYGLVTRNGEVVADPVFTSAFYLTAHDDFGNSIDCPSVMLLGKVFYNTEGQPEERYALCAGDGSWCSEFLYDYDYEGYFSLPFSQGIPLLTKDKKGLVFLDAASGEKLRVLDLEAHGEGTDYGVNSFHVDARTGWTSVNLYYLKSTENWEYAYIPLLFDPQGNFHPLPANVWNVREYGDGLVAAAATKDDGVTISYRYGYVDAATGEWAIEPSYTQVEAFENGVAPVCDGTGIHFINTAGETLTESYGNRDSYWPTHHGEYWYEEIGKDTKVILDEKLEPVVDSPLLGTSNWTFLPDGWVRGKGEEEWVLARGTEEVYRFPVSLGLFKGIRKDRALFVKEGGRNLGVVTLTDLEGNVIARWDQYSSAYMNDEGYVYAFVYGDSTYDAYYDLNGNQLPAGDRQRPVQGKYIYENGDDATTVIDLDGNVIFRWPIYSADD